MSRRTIKDQQCSRRGRAVYLLPAAGEYRVSPRNLGVPSARSGTVRRMLQVSRSCSMAPDERKSEWAVSLKVGMASAVGAVSDARFSFRFRTIRIFDHKTAVQRPPLQPEASPTFTIQSLVTLD